MGMVQRVLHGATGALTGQGARPGKEHLLLMAVQVKKVNGIGVAAGLGGVPGAGGGSIGAQGGTFRAA